MTWIVSMFPLWWVFKENREELEDFKIAFINSLTMELGSHRRGGWESAFDSRRGENVTLSFGLKIYFW